MNNGFDLMHIEFVDPGRVRNFLLDAKNDASRKNYSNLFHIIYALVCSAIIYLACASTAFSILPCCIASAMCVFTFLYSPTVLKLLPITLAPAAFFIRAAVGGFKTDYYTVAAFCFIYILCLASSAIMTKTVLSGYTKNTVFIILSAVYAIIIFCIIVFSFISTTGSFSPDMITDRINGYFDAVMKTSNELVSSPEGYQMLSLFYSGDTTPTQEETATLFISVMQKFCDSVKICIPSIFALSCMLYGFLTVACFSVVAKTFRINVFVSIMDNFWTYRPGIVTSTVYDILFFAVIIGIFLPFSQSVSATIINLLIIITPAMCLSGMRGIYSFFERKIKTGIVSFIITAIIVFVLIGTLGAVATLIISSIGVLHISSKSREESILLPIKYASDMELYEKLYANNKDNSAE